MATKKTSNHDATYDRWGYTPNAIKVVRKSKKSNTSGTTKKKK